MSTVALATCGVERTDPDEEILLRALRENGVDAQWRSWDDVSVDWSNYELVVIRSTWNYVGARDQFLSWTRSLRRVENPTEVLEENTDKHYLGRLRDAGIAIIPTTFCDVGSAPAFPDSDFVVKPAVGAGSIDASRYRADEVNAARLHVTALHDQGRDVVIQPYVSNVDRDGELALVHVGGQFAHAMRKGALLNTPQLDRSHLFMVEQLSNADAPADAIEFARDVFDAAGYGPLLYGRVDAVKWDGQWALMELEVTEPSLFLSFHPPTAQRLAQEVSRLIDSRQSD